MCSNFFHLICENFHTLVKSEKVRDETCAKNIEFIMSYPIIEDHLMIDNDILKKGHFL